MPRTRALAEFYKATFGMAELTLGAEGSPAIYLSDGYIQFVILPARGQREGVDHFGFEVESVEAIAAAAAAAAGPAWKPPYTPPGQFANLRIYDPVGAGIDLGTHWQA
jgi:hypothetical protein